MQSQNPRIKANDIASNNAPIDLTAPSIFKVTISKNSDQEKKETKPRFISPSHLSSSSSHDDSDSPPWETEQITNQEDTSNNASPRARIVFSSGIPTKDWAYDFRTYEDYSPSNNAQVTTGATQQNFGQANTMILSVVSNYDKNEKDNDGKNKEACPDNVWTPRNDNRDLETKDGTDASQRSPL